MIEKIINDYLLAEQKINSERVRSGLMSPSSFGRCYRYQYWHRENKPATNLPDERTLRIFQLGHIFEQFIVNILKLKGIVAEYQVRCCTEDVLGFADIVMPDKVIDIKTQHSRGFWYMQQEGFDFDTEKATHCYQVAFYAMVLNKPQATICYVSKDDLCLMERAINLNTWIPRVQAEIKKNKEFWDKKEVPPCEPRTYSGKEGKYCPYRDVCGKECKPKKGVKDEDKV